MRLYDGSGYGCRCSCSWNFVDAPSALPTLRVNASASDAREGVRTTEYGWIRMPDPDGIVCSMNDFASVRVSGCRKNRSVRTLAIRLEDATSTSVTQKVDPLSAPLTRWTRRA